MEEIKKEEVKETKKEIKDAGMQENKKQDAKKEKNASKEKNTKKEIEVPEGFAKKTNLNKKEYGYHNGRKYLKLKNGYGMWADTGQGFNLSDLD